jgi:hypothetical protein
MTEKKKSATIFDFMTGITSKKKEWSEWSEFTESDIHINSANSKIVALSTINS